MNRRRRFLKTIAVAGGPLATGSMVSLITQAQAPAGAPPPAAADPTQSLGRAVSEYGRRSRFETAVRVPFATKTKQSSWTFTPLQDSHGIITPSALHFERHHAGVPDIDPGQHRLLIHGLVKTLSHPEHGGHPPTAVGVARAHDRVLRQRPDGPGA